MIVLNKSIALVLFFDRMDPELSIQLVNNLR